MMSETESHAAEDAARKAVQYLTPVDDNSLGFNLGGGAIGFFSRRTGVRFELRHFRTFEREAREFGDIASRVSFWRFTVGAVVRY
jgi:hypothetical protein